MGAVKHKLAKVNLQGTAPEFIYECIDQFPQIISLLMVWFTPEYDFCVQICLNQNMG